MSTSIKTGYVRRVLMAGTFAAAAVLTIGAGIAPAHAQYYSSQYNNPYYSNPNYSNQYQYGYPAQHAWWRWHHQYWRWYHQYYR
jgi:hypothetical protein